MARDLLLEIGLEEIPAKYVRTSSEQLKARLSTFFEENRLTFEQIDVYATPRRLAAIVRQLAEKQADLSEEVKGPAKKIALDADGNWTKAAQGFVSGQGLSVDAIFWKTIKDVEYAHIKKEVIGQNTAAVLTQLKDVILKMTFPVSMTWGNHRLKYIRPIHWLIALYGQETIPFHILDVHTDTQTRGHRFLGHTFSIEGVDTYLAQLEADYVIADQDKRKAMIVSQIEELAKTNQWQVPMDAELLEEVTSIVEYPSAFVGRFDEKYLAVPEEVLITSMKEHQRYFYVKDLAGNLLPYFIAVRNGNTQYIENVIKGNEKVLVARLEDALFFTLEDAKLQIADLVEKLKRVNFHVKIGSIHEKMARVQQIVTILADLLQLDASDALRAAHIYKFDLVTNMVGEFPELQGIMGEKYALAQGENKAVAQAIREHYLPLSSEGALPESHAGAILALADKIDTLISFFIADMIPSGSNDPYALRRQAIGIVAILEKQQWAIDLNALFATLANTIYQVTDATTLLQQLAQFMAARLQQRLQTEHIRHDVIEAVLASQQASVPTLLANAHQLQAASQTDTFKTTIEASSRVLNLATKVETISNVDAQLFETASERQLWQAVQTLPVVCQYEHLVAVAPAIHAFFDDNMVLVDNQAVRQNRLAILYTAAQRILSYADTTKLVVK